jgi:hypothetical protein
MRSVSAILEPVILRRTGDAATRLRPQGGGSIWSEAEREAAARA